MIIPKFVRTSGDVLPYPSVPRESAEGLAPYDQAIKDGKIVADFPGFHPMQEVPQPKDDIDLYQDAVRQK
jgi:hypothetical protein